MKKLMSFALLITSVSLFAEVINVSKIKKEAGMERSYILTTNLSETVVIDCQSFIQGLRIGDFEDAHTIMMGEEECEGLQKNVQASLKKKQHHCIDVDQDIRADYTCP